jgi:hypothetical protein
VKSGLILSILKSEVEAKEEVRKYDGMSRKAKSRSERTKKQNKGEMDRRKSKDRLHSIALDSVYPLRIIITAIIVAVLHVHAQPQEPKPI